MHINVRDILAESVGFTRDYTVSGERPRLEAVTLTEDIVGEITISRLDDSLLVRGHATTKQELECHRCLRTFSRPVRINFSQKYSETPTDDDMPIIDDSIDLAPLVEQEIIVGLPIKVLCREDCSGIEGASEKYMKAASGTSLKHQAHIKKGS